MYLEREEKKIKYKGSETVQQNTEAAHSGGLSLAPFNENFCSTKLSSGNSSDNFCPLPTHIHLLLFLIDICLIDL